MTPGARLAAAAEILAEIFAARSAADRTIANWGRAHRFAGAKDRAAIADRVYTVLRRRNEFAYALDSGAPRALMLGSLKIVDGLDLDHIEALCADGAHALGALTPDERANLARTKPAPSEPWIRLNYPAWLHDELSAAFKDDLEIEMAALNERAPLDLRVNTLSANRDDVLRELSEAGIDASPCAYSRAGVRVAPGREVKVAALPAYKEGRIEVQDEGSQLAVLLAEARPGQTVIDLAAGGGGKGLALAAEMANRGRVLACDVEPARLRQIEPRIGRAGARIVEIVGDPYGGAIATAAPKVDLIFVDAPCSGTGTWRRNPETRWTLDAGRLTGFHAAQAKLLERAAALSTPSAKIVYVVCSPLPSEGRQQIDAFLSRHPSWSATPVSAVWPNVVAAPPPKGAARFAELTPARAATDGFFVALLQRRGS